MNNSHHLPQTLALPLAPTVFRLRRENLKHGPSRPFAGAAAASSIRCETFSSLQAVESIWRGFERQAVCTPYQCFDWVAPFHAHIGNNDCSALIVVVRSGGRIVAILPLSVDVRYGTKICRWLGSSHANYLMPLFLPGFADRWVREGVMAILRQIADQNGIAVFDFTNQPRTWRGQAVSLVMV